MQMRSDARVTTGSEVVRASGETRLFEAGDRVKISSRRPVGHYRVPTYLRGKTARIEKVMEPRQLNNEEEGFGRNAGDRRFYYRIWAPMTDVWPDYAGAAQDTLRIEVFESWLEGADA